ncbi:MAG: helix-turn-helix domain-containing protein [Candidatus Diapherotrites archaeon]|nr:helix-turn-helix domain-containing protein [Candidatus Diapherotrites archaeon]
MVRAFRNFLPVLFAVLLLSSCAAQEYYADVKIVLSENGSAEISGTSNHELFVPGQTQEFTSKQGAIWSLDISAPETFSQIVYEIIFPEGASIEKIVLPGNYRVETNGSQISIIGVAENSQFNAEADYLILPKNFSDYVLPAILLLLFLAAIAAVLYFLVFREKKFLEKESPRETEPAPKKYNKESLTERQLQIIDYLEKKGSAVMQSELQKSLGLPKASLSRNLDSLARKEIISKERKGMSMVVFLKK